MSEDKKTSNDLGFTLNGKDYDFNALSDEQKYVVQQLKDIQVQLDRIEFQHTQVSGAKQHFTDQLVKSVEASESTESETSVAEPTAE